MKTIKILPLLLLAAAFTVAWAGPSAASASEWTAEGEPVSGSTYGIDAGDEWTVGSSALKAAAEVELTASLALDLAYSETPYGEQISCDVLLDATLEPGSEGSLDGASVDPGSCDSSGFLDGCDVTEAAATNLPQSLAAEGGAIEIAGLSIEYALSGAECNAEEITVHHDSLTATPDNPGAITVLSVDGEGTTEAFGVEWEGTTEGSAAMLTGAASFDLEEGALETTSILFSLACSGVEGEGVLYPGSDEGAITQVTFTQPCTEAVSECAYEGDVDGPWQVQAGTSDLSITNVAFEIVNVSDEGCGSRTFEGSFTATPDSQSEMSSLDLEGIMSLTPGIEGIEVVGEFNLSPAYYYGFS